MGNSHHYFGAGPAALPEEVKQHVRLAVDRYADTPVSILELSHRSEEFAQILNQARCLLRSLYAIPDNYHILFMQGGATNQFDAVPLNILGNAKHATYLDTGLWSRKAASLAGKYTDVKIIPGLGQDENKLSCVSSEQWSISSDTAYLHITPNETVDGIAMQEIPVLDVPVVADMTSCLLMREVDFSRYAIIYAGAQKTLGIAGVTIVIVRDDMLDRAARQTPDLFRYDFHMQENSIVNTSPVFACYVTKLMLEWVDNHGGIKVMREQAKVRADKLYSAIDVHPSLENNISEASRSHINVVFNSEQDSLIKSFLQGAQANGLTGLAGHRFVGGVRASMYNGTPMEAVKKLSAFIGELS